MSDHSVAHRVVPFYNRSDAESKTGSYIRRTVESFYKTGTLTCHILYVHACLQCVHESVLFTPPCTLPTVPDPPQSLSVVNYGTSQLRATWVPPNEVFDDESQVRYNIIASTGTGSDVTVQNASREQVITGLQPGTTYTVMVCYILIVC